MSREREEPPWLLLAALLTAAFAFAAWVSDGDRSSREPWAPTGAGPALAAALDAGWRPPK